MGELEELARLKSYADKEFVVTRLETRGAPALFESQLSGGHTRKRLLAYNNTASGSGEVVYGGAACNVGGMILQKGVQTEIPIADALAEDGVTGGVKIYFANESSGEAGDLRVIELA